MSNLQKAGAERASAENNCTGKKAKVTAEAEAAVSKITLTVDPKLLECSGCCSPLVPPIFQVKEPGSTTQYSLC